MTESAELFVRRGLLPADDAQAMGQWQHGGGFSVDGSVRLEAADRAERERPLRYCARPPFALDRWRERDREHLIYDPPKAGPGGSGPQRLTPRELLDRLAALVPPPHVHRHRYFGVLAPNSPLRTAVTALAPGATTAPPAPNAQPAAEPAPRRAARYALALLLARIYEVFPLVCPGCGGAMRIIAFITDGPTVRDILGHLGEPTAPPRIAPARGPPLWAATDPEHDRCAAPLLQSAPAFEFDQRLALSTPLPQLERRLRSICMTEEAAVEVTVELTLHILRHRPVVVVTVAALGEAPVASSMAACRKIPWRHRPADVRPPGVAEGGGFRRSRGRFGQAFILLKRSMSVIGCVGEGANP